MITQEQLKKIVHYDPDTGIFTRLHRPYGCRVLDWQNFGTTHNAGYLHVCINYDKYLLHRLAWLYVHGYMPKEIDHINKNKRDNRIKNLREVTRQQNKLNQGPQSNNTSGYRGIDFLAHLGKYRVRVAKEHLGLFESIEDAIAVRNKRLAQYFEKIRG